MPDAPALYVMLGQRIDHLRRGWMSWRRARDIVLMERSRTVIDEMIDTAGKARRALSEEQARSAALERDLASALEAAGFERGGFDKLGSVHDSLGTVKDLLKALDLIGDGIGGPVGFAVSAVANEAAMSAENAFCEAGSMIEMRGKVVSP